jgi:hypothetical protein
LLLKEKAALNVVPAGELRGNRKMFIVPEKQLSELPRPWGNSDNCRRIIEKEKRYFLTTLFIHR